MLPDFRPALLAIILIGFFSNGTATADDEVLDSSVEWLIGQQQTESGVRGRASITAR